MQPCTTFCLYKLYDLCKQKVVQGCNVVFMEDQTIKDIRAQTAVTPSQSEEEDFHDVANGNWQREESAQGEQQPKPMRAKELARIPEPNHLGDQEGSHDYQIGMYLIYSP